MKTKVLVMMVAVLAMVGVVKAAEVWNASDDFSITGMPSHDWSYGVIGGPYDATGYADHEFGNNTIVPGGIEAWYTPTPGQDNVARGHVARNPGTTAVHLFNLWGTSDIMRAGEVAMRTSMFNIPDKQVIRWTAPAAGTYQVDVVLSGISYPGAGTVAPVAIAKNGVDLFTDTISGFIGSTEFSEPGFGANPTTSYSSALTLVAGDTIDIIQTNMGTDAGGSCAVGVDATIVLGAASGKFGVAAIPPTIDGAYDAAWADAVVYSDYYVSDGENPNDVMDLRVRYCGMWDANNLYILVEVTDDILNRDSGALGFMDDSIEIYTDVHEKNTTYGAGDIYQTTCPIEFGLPNPLTIAPQGQPVSGGTIKMVVNANSYVLEAALPWANLGTAYTAAIGNIIGFGIGINDADVSDSVRNTQFMWATTKNDLWDTSNSFPSVELVEVAGPQTTCAEAWATGFGLLGDVNKDCVVDFKDFAMLSVDWLECTEPSDPNCW